MASELAYYYAPSTEPKFCVLDRTYCESIIDLEQRCYPSPWSPELIRAEFSKDVSLRCGLVTDDEIIAYCFNYLVADELHVLNLAVHPTYRARGFGKKLLIKVLRHAYSYGARYATLEVRQSNYIAKRLYSRLGFEVLGMRKNYYRDNQEHALVLQCHLTLEMLR